MGLDRGPLLADDSLTGQMWCRAHSDLVDAWLSELLHHAGGTTTSGAALVAVGGYGRAELCPQSDIDVMLVHDRGVDVTAIAERIWYPVWDQELHLGHSVCTVRGALALGADDLDTATSLLSARLVAGDPGPAAKLAAGAFDRWRKRSRHVLLQIADRVEQRHEKAGDVAFRQEPDLKEGRGGLRDVHALRWAAAAQEVLFDGDTAILDEAYATLLEARVELQRLTGRAANVLALEHQPSVAGALGLSSADELMGRVAEAARAIAWTSDDAWRRLAASFRGSRGPAGTGNVRAPGAGLRLGGAEVFVDDDVDAADHLLVLRAAATAARQGAVIERRSLERLSATASPWLEPWTEEARAELIGLLSAGPWAVRVIEALDRRGVWGCILPEWRAVRSLPQTGALHDFTVDRHLLETVAAASRLTPQVPRPDLLLMAALLHDIGKGSSDDHAEAGGRLADRICERLGFAPDDVSSVAWLVGQHLLLRDVSTRRDIDDPATTELVANQVGTADRLHLLAALTEADGVATSATAWDPWTAQLIARLVERVEHRLHGSGSAASVASFPTEDQLTRLMDGERRIEVTGDVVTVMTTDRPGVFSRVAGVLALHGLDVLAASAYSANGRALAEFRVTDPFRDETPWPRVIADLELVLDGRLALQARLSERVRTYARRTPGTVAGPAPTVRFDDQASDKATVIDVQAADAIGVLYRITHALAELDLDIRSARVQTLGERVHDAFYVRDRGGKITDARTLAEIERAILHSLAQ
jgi:[protein-PII] uridylyltransferase